MKHIQMTNGKTIWQAYAKLNINADLDSKITDRQNEIIANEFPNGGATTKDFGLALKQSCSEFGFFINVIGE